MRLSTKFLLVAFGFALFVHIHQHVVKVWPHHFESRLTIVQPAPPPLPTPVRVVTKIRTVTIVREAPQVVAPTDATVIVNGRAVQVPFGK